jgi:major membrane immunogen (membrane-anchored lipoprotein)
MRNFLLIAIGTIYLASCGNNSSKTAQTFCDTTCTNDTLKFNGNDTKWKQSLSISMKDCKPDTMTWTYQGANATRKAAFSDYVSQDVRVNKSAINVAFQDTAAAWISFNDCFTGRGYLVELAYRSGKSTIHTSAALNAFDKKFSIDPDLRAYTDRGNIFVVNVTNGKEAQMTFKENYADMDFNDIHKTIDTINITKNRIYVKLLKDGQEVPLEKNVSL